MSDKTLNNSWYGISIGALTSYFSGVTRSGLGRVLLSRFLVLSLVPMAFVGWVSEQQAIEIIEKSQYDKLNTIALAKSNQLSDYFTGLETNLRLQAELDNTVEFMEKLVDGYEESNKSLKDYTAGFHWANLEDQYGQDLFNFLSTYSYIDILLLDTSGNVLYSIRRDDELGSNLFTGKYVKTKFSLAAKRSLKTGISTYSDIEFYEPYNNRISSFMVQAIIDEYGDPIGLLSIHIGQIQIQKIMSDRTGMGASGESYLVGVDKLMRTESLYIEPSILNVQINTVEVNRWLDHVNSEQEKDWKEVELGEGELSYTGYRGEKKLGVSHQVVLADVVMLMLVEIDEAEAYLPAARLINVIIGIILFTVVVVFIVALISARNITRPIVQLTEWAEKLSIGSLSKRDIATPNNEIGVLNRTFTELVQSMQEITWVLESFSVGDLTKEIKPRCEDDVMVVAINQLSDSMESVVQQAKEIASGEYALEFKVRGERDVLGNALENMTAALRDATLENESQNWSKTGLAGLSEKMRGDLSLSKLSEEVIDYTCKHVSARVGVIYVINDEGLLVCTGGYALDLTSGKKQQYSIGQGLIGQCAKDREIILIKDVPQNYMQVESGLGSSRPLEIILVPLIYNNNIYGVVELGFLNAVRKMDIDFLSIINESIAISIHTVFSRLKINQTLSQVQEKSEALQAQQEELKSSNEELEEQTQLLRQSEEELKATNEELEEKSKRLKIQKESIEKKSIEVEEKALDLAAASKYKSEFLANMSHELRTPLNSLLILAKLLKDNKENNLSEQQVEWARVISNSGADLLELINDILDLSKVEAGKLDVDIETLSLESLVDSLEDKFRPVADDKGVKFVVEKKLKTIHEVQSDRQRLGQILKNMLSNAVKFTAKGQIKLSIYHPEGNIQLTKAHLKPDNCIALSVSDTGIGIKQEKLDAIFSAFQQADGSTSRKYGGTGLGLSISRELSHLLGGEITVESKEGEGSRFILYLPYDYVNGDCAEGDSAKVAKKPDKSSSNVTDITDSRKGDRAPVKIVPSIEKFIDDDHVKFTENKKSVLIIEDNKDFAISLLELVRQHDFIGLVAGDGRSGMKMANEYRPTAILLDLGLPDMKGEDVLKYVKKNTDTRHIPVHIVSGKEEDSKYLQLGAIGFLTKPFDEQSIKKLFFKINEIVENESKNILLVEDDEKSRIAISSLLTNEYTNVITADNVKAAKEVLDTKKIDCLLIDLGLPDSFEISFIGELKEKTKGNCPVIIHTGKDLSNEDLHELNKTADSVIIKGDKSRERLLDETMLFLHHVESKLPQSQRSVISSLHNVEVFFKDKCVLIVDDDMRNLFALSGVLSEYDIHIIMADNGQDALDKLEETPQIDLVLMDIMMPVMDGYEAMGRIRKNKKTADIPIIALTAKAMPADRVKCINAGASDYLAKPIDTDKLLSLMRVWMHK